MAAQVPPMRARGQLPAVVAVQLRLARERCGLTGVAAARLVGVSGRSYHQYESGVIRPSIAVAERLITNLALPEPAATEVRLLAAQNAGKSRTTWGTSPAEARERMCRFKAKRKAEQQAAAEAERERVHSREAAAESAGVLDDLTLGP